MNIRKRSGLMKGAGGSAPRNANTAMKSSVSQARGIRNAVSEPKSQGPQKVKGAVLD